MAFYVVSNAFVKSRVDYVAGFADHQISTILVLLFIMIAIYSTVILRPKGMKAQLGTVFVPRDVWLGITRCNFAVKACPVCLQLVNGFAR